MSEMFKLFQRLAPLVHHICAALRMCFCFFILITINIAITIITIILCVNDNDNNHFCIYSQSVKAAVEVSPALFVANPT